MLARTAIRSWLLVVALALSGCANGPAFKNVADVPQGKALIYIYRPPVMLGAALVPAVVIDKLNAIQLTMGGYYPYFADPGEVTVAVIHTGRKAITLSAKAGETYYLKAGTIIFGAPYLEAFNADVALPELKECKRLPVVDGVSAPPMPAL
jgi:hypothetical protein